MMYITFYNISSYHINIVLRQEDQGVNLNGDLIKIKLKKNDFMNDCLNINVVTGISLHLKLFKDPFERKLPRIGNVAMVTDDLWYDVIERSHAPTHPLYAGAEWRGEVTQVSLVCWPLIGGGGGDVACRF